MAAEYPTPCWDADVWISERLVEPSVINATAVGFFVDLSFEQTNSSTSSHSSGRDQILVCYGSALMEVRDTRMPMPVVWEQQLLGENTSHIIAAKKVNLGCPVDAVMLLTPEGTLFILQWMSSDTGFVVREVRPFKHEDFNFVPTGVWDLRQSRTAGEIILVRSAVSEKILLSSLIPIPRDNDVQMAQSGGAAGPEYVTAEFSLVISLKGLTTKRSERMALSGAIRDLCLFEDGLAVALCSPFNGATVCVLAAPSYTTITLLVDPSITHTSIMNSSLRIAAVADSPGSNSTPLSLMLGGDGKFVIAVCDMMLLKIEGSQWSAHRVALRGASADTVGSKRYDERCCLLEEEKDGRGALIEDPPPPGSIVPSPQLLRFVKSLSVWGTNARRATLRGMSNSRPAIVQSTPLPPIAPMRRPPMCAEDMACLGMITATSCILQPSLGISGAPVVLLADPMGKLWSFSMSTEGHAESRGRQILEVSHRKDFLYPCPARQLIPVGEEGHVLCVGECGAPSQLVKIERDVGDDLRVASSLPWPPTPVDRPFLPAPISRICNLPKGPAQKDDDDTSLPCPEIEHHSEISTAVALSGKYPKSCLSFIVLDSPRVSLEAEVARIGPYPPQDMFVVQVENGAILLLAFPECTRAVFVADAASPESPLLEELEESPWLRGESASLRAVLADGELMVYEDGVYVVDSLEGASRLLLSPPEDGHIIENAAFAPDISVLAIVCAGRISVYSYEGFVERLVLLCSCTSVNGGKNGTTFCEFSPMFVNGQQEELLVVGTFLGTLEVYSLRNKKTIEWKQTVTLRKSEVSTEVVVPESICFTRMTEDDTGVYAFVGSRDGDIFHLLLDGRGLTCLGRVQGGPSGCSARLAHIETRDGDDVPIALFKNSSLAVLCEYSTKVGTENSSASEGGEKKPEEVGFSVHPVPLGLAPLLVGEIGPNGRVAVVATTALPDGRPYIVIGNIDDDIVPCATFNYTMPYYCRTLEVVDKNTAFSLCRLPSPGRWAVTQISIKPDSIGPAANLNDTAGYPVNIRQWLPFAPGDIGNGTHREVPICLAICRFRLPDSTAVLAVGTRYEPLEALGVKNSARASAEDGIDIDHDDGRTTGGRLLLLDPGSLKIMCNMSIPFTPVDNICCVTENLIAFSSHQRIFLLSPRKETSRSGDVRINFVTVCKMDREWGHAFTRLSPIPRESWNLFPMNKPYRKDLAEPEALFLGSSTHDGLLVLALFEDCLRPIYVQSSARCLTAVRCLPGGNGILFTDRDGYVGVLGNSFLPSNEQVDTLLCEMVSTNFGEVLTDTVVVGTAGGVGPELLLPSMSGSLRRLCLRRKFVSTKAIDGLRKVSLGGAREVCRRLCILHEEVAHPSIIRSYNSLIPGRPLPQAVLDGLVVQRMHE